jgi:hypothetical protein
MCPYCSMTCGCEAHGDGLRLSVAWRLNCWVDDNRLCDQILMATVGGFKTLVCVVAPP